MTVLLSFEENTDDARACAQSGHCPFKCNQHLQLATEDILLFMASGVFCNSSGNGLISKRETIMES